MLLLATKVIRFQWEVKNVVEFLSHGTNNGIKNMNPMVQKQNFV